MKLSKEELLAYVAAHPGVTSPELANAFGLIQSDASARLVKAHKAGNLNRVEVRRLATGITIYGYTLVEGTAGLNKQERLVKAGRDRANIGQTSGKAMPMFDLSSGIAALAEGIAKQIASQVVHALQGQLTRELAGVVPPVISAPPVTISQPLKVETPKIEAPVVLDPLVIDVLKHQLKHQRLPKVAIIGVTPQQAGILSTEFSDTYDLSFWHNDGIPRLRSIGISCELCLVTKFVSHKTTEVLTSQGAHWRKVTGGIDSIRDALTGYYVERT